MQAEEVMTTPVVTGHPKASFEDVASTRFDR
jgi:hypothetical protein